MCDPGRYSPARSGLMGSPRRGRTYEFGASFARDVTGFRDEIGGGLGSGWRSGTSPERAFGGRPGWGVGNDVVGGVGDSSTPVEYARDEVIRRLERVNEELRGEVVELKERMRGMEAEMRTVVGGLLERVGVLEREMKRVGEERTARGGTVSDEHGGALASRSASGTGTGSTPVSEREEVREGAGGKKKVDVIDHPVMHYTPPPTMSGECTPPEKGLVRDEQVRDDGVEEVVVGEAVRKVGKGDEVGGGHGMSRSEMSDASPEVRAVGVDAGAESDGRNVKKAWEAGGGNEHVEKEMKSGNGDGVAFRRSTGGVGRDEGDQVNKPFVYSHFLFVFVCLLFADFGQIILGAHSFVYKQTPPKKQNTTGHNVPPFQNQHTIRLVHLFFPFSNPQPPCWYVIHHPSAITTAGITRGRRKGYSGVEGGGNPTGESVYTKLGRTPSPDFGVFEIEESGAEFCFGVTFLWDGGMVGWGREGGVFRFVFSS